MRHVVRHGLGTEAATQAIRTAWVSYAERFARFAPKATWSSPTRAQVAFVVPGGTVSGTLEVTTEDIVIDLEVPLMLRPFKGKAVEVVEREIATWVDRARRGSLGPT